MSCIFLLDEQDCKRHVASRNQHMINLLVEIEICRVKYLKLDLYWTYRSIVKANRWIKDFRKCLTMIGRVTFKTIRYDQYRPSFICLYFLSNRRIDKLYQACLTARVSVQEVSSAHVFYISKNVRKAYRTDNYCCILLCTEYRPTSGEATNPTLIALDFLYYLPRSQFWHAAWRCLFVNVLIYAQASYNRKHNDYLSDINNIKVVVIWINNVMRYNNVNSELMKKI